jgi:hypothetical protein
MIMKDTKANYARRLTWAVVTAVVFGAGAFATKVSAQTGGGFEIQVPFDFTVVGQTYPAAKYRISRLDAANPDVLVLRSAADKALLIFRTERISYNAPAASSWLSFRRSGETNYLHGVRASGESYESRLPASGPDRRGAGAAQVARTIIIAHK